MLIVTPAAGVLTRGLKVGGAPVRIKCVVEISAILNYAIVQQLAFFAFVCITQLFLALQYLRAYRITTME